MNKEVIKKLFNLDVDEVGQINFIGTSWESDQDSRILIQKFFDSADCPHKFVESKYEFEDYDNGDRKKFLVIFCEKCGTVIKKEISIRIDAI